MTVVNLVNRCPFCGQATEVEVNEEDYVRYCDGVSVQNAFPYLGSSEREILITGICYTCQSRIFGGGC